MSPPAAVRGVIAISAGTSTSSTYDSLEFSDMIKIRLSPISVEGEPGTLPAVLCAFDYVQISRFVQHFQMLRKHRITNAQEIAKASELDLGHRNKVGADLQAVGCVYDFVETFAAHL
jgi:hypothetical protein